MLRKLLIILIIAAVLGGGYYFYTSQQQSASTGSLVSSSNGVTKVANPAAATDVTVISDIGQEFLSSLLSLKKMSLNDGVFTDPAFISLQDFTRPLIPLGNEGRANPFGPIGTDASTVTNLLSAQAAGSTTPQSASDNSALLNQLLNQSTKR